MGAKLCDGVRGAFKDFEGKTCGEDGACAPPGVCSEIILRVQSDSPERLSGVWDLGSDPDQERNLQDGGYLAEWGPSSLATEFRACLRELAFLDPNSSWQRTGECLHLKDW
jgi:hypothetical protein